MLDALTYAGSTALARRRRWSGSRFVEGDVADADARRRARRRRRRRRALRRRVAQRQLARRPEPVRAHQPDRHLHAARGGPAARRAATTTSPPTRSTATSSSTTRRSSPRTTPYNPSSPVLARPRPASDLLVRAWVRSFGVQRHDLELLEQLRPAPARREVHPAADHQRARRRAAQALRRRAERARLDPRRRPQRRGVDRSSTRAGSARPTSSAPTARATTATSSRLILELMGQPAGRVRPRHRPRRARPALRHRRRPGCAPSSAGPRATPTSATGLAATIDWYRDNEAWWRPMKDAAEAKYARTQQVVTR